VSTSSPPSTTSIPRGEKRPIRLTNCRLWNHTDWELNLRNQDLITNTFIPSLADLIPGGGSAYLNQADFREPDWQQVFYGETYETLLQAKAKYDPDDLFWGMTAVGSDRWAETEDKRLCRVS